MEIANPKKVKLIKKISKIFSIFYHTKKIENPINFEETKEIIIFDPAQIGDTIMIMPFLQSVRENFKNAKITLVCASHAKIILKDTNLIDNFIICNGAKSFLSITNIIKDFKNLKSVIKQINIKDYDIAIEPRGDFRYIYFMHFMHSKRKISFNYSGGECFLTDVIDMPENYKTSHITDDKLFLLEKIGAENNKYLVPNLYITKELEDKKKNFIIEHHLEKYKLIGIHPGAREKIRRYEKFDELLKNIYSKNKNVAFIIFEGIDEEIEVNKVLQAANECGAIAIKLKDNLENYLKNISIIDTMICNDSSAGHIANAYKIPTTVIYGPVNPEGIRPYNNKTAILNCVSIPLKCKPCYGSNECPNGTYQCFNDINIDKLADEILKTIEQTEGEIN